MDRMIGQERGNFDPRYRKTVHSTVRTSFPAVLAPGLGPEPIVGVRHPTLQAYRSRNQARHGLSFLLLGSNRGSEFESLESATVCMKPLSDNCSHWRPELTL